MENGRIRADMVVEEVLERHPGIIEVFLRYGFRELQNPVLRRTLARVATLEMACRLRGVDLQGFLGELNRFVEEGRSSGKREGGGSGH